MNVINSVINGLQLGGITMLISSILDNTISSKETTDLIKSDSDLYIQGLQSNQ